jgi:glycerophosphoryl diester phosphodiesterase
MGPGPEPILTWRRAILAVARAWKPLICYEILVSAFATMAVGPLILAVSYRLIEFSGEPILGNSELAAFLLSPIGILALVLGLSLTLGLLLIQYSGLILLIDSVLRENPTSVRRVVWEIGAAAPRLCGLAVIQTICAVLAALPFLGLAGLTYWLLLSADINYYLAERPPRFWLAAIIGTVLGLGLAASTAWFFLRFAFAVPACVLGGQNCWAALRSSMRLMDGRAIRLLLILIAWQLLEQAAIVAAIAGLDQINRALAATFEGRLTILVGSTVGLLLLDTVVLQLAGAVFAIGRALLITVEYEHARRSGSDFSTISNESKPVVPWQQGWRARAAVVAVLVVGPVASLLYAVAVANEFVERRPVRVTAHRAGSKAALENSLAALRLSMTAGADYVEIDVQQTADGHVVLMHDRDLRRMTGDPRDVAAVTLADLNKLKLGTAGRSGDEPIPTLAEFLAACDDRIRLNVELKETERSPGLPMAVLDVLHERGFTARAGVSCFRLVPLAEIRRAEPQVPIGMILSAVQGDMTRLPVDFLSLNQRLVRASLVRQAHRRGIEVHAWTVNDRESALRLLDLGCDNLITSDPVLMREIVDWYAGLGDAERMLMRLRRWMRE